MTSTRVRLLALASVALGFVGYSTAAQAVTCPSDTECNDNSYTATFANMGGNTYQATVTVNVLGAQYDGVNFMLSALAIKSMTSGGASNVSLLSYPGGGDPFALFLGELNNGGDVCDNQGSTNDAMCAWAGDGKGVLIDQGDVLSFVFQFDAASLVDTLHIKYQYLENDCKTTGGPNGGTTCEWKKYGSIGSFDIPFTSSSSSSSSSGSDTSTSSSGTTVPEPASSLVLLGLGLLGVGFMRRRAHSA